MARHMRNVTERDGTERKETKVNATHTQHDTRATVATSSFWINLSIKAVCHFHAIHSHQTTVYTSVSVLGI